MCQMSREIYVNGKNMGKMETILVEGGWAIYSASFLLQIFLWDLHDSEINLARNLSSRWPQPPSARWYHGTVPVAILQWELLAVLAPGHADKWLPYGLSTVRTSYIYGHPTAIGLEGGWFKPDGDFVTCGKFGMFFFGCKFLGGGNSNIFYFHPDPWGNDPIWRAYFSNGLVQPPTRNEWMDVLKILDGSPLAYRPMMADHGIQASWSGDDVEVVLVSWRDPWGMFQSCSMKHVQACVFCLFNVVNWFPTLCTASSI